MGTAGNATSREPWNKNKIVGQKAPFKLKDIWALRVRLQMEGRVRELALFNLGIDSKLRGCDLVALKVRDVCHGGARQGSCRLVHAASGCVSTHAERALTTASRSGFSVTATMGVQLRVTPDQRRGWRSRACRYSSWRAARIAVSSPA